MGKHTQVTQTAAKLAAAALKKHQQREIESQKQADKARKVQHKKKTEAEFRAQVAAGQTAAAAVLSQNKAMNKAEHAAQKYNKSKEQLLAAQKKVVHLQAEKLAQKANTKPLMWKALTKEYGAEEKVSKTLQQVAEIGQTQEAAEMGLNAKAQRLRAVTTQIKNSLEHQLDTAQQEVIAQLGESKGPSPVAAEATAAAAKRAANIHKAAEGKTSVSKWKEASNKEQAVLRAEKKELGNMVNMAQQMSLAAAKVQEDQHEAADESSRLEATARVTSSMLNEKKEELHMQKANPNTAQIQAALNKASAQDHKAFVSLGHINGEATNSAAEELSSTKQTANEVRVGGKLMNKISESLMPSY